MSRRDLETFFFGTAMTSSFPAARDGSLTTYRIDRKRPLDNQKTVFSQAELYFGRLRKFCNTMKGLTLFISTAGPPEGP